jgi:hypothetical protein
MSATGVARSDDMIMRVTLHQGASDTYYGQWTPEKTAIPGLESRPIAHKGAAASAKSATWMHALAFSSKIEARLAGNLHRP